MGWYNLDLIFNATAVMLLKLFTDEKDLHSNKNV